MSNFAKLSTTLGLKFGPVRGGVTPRKILEFVLNDLVMIQADSALVTDPEIVARFAGQTDAYKKVAHFIAPFKDIEIEKVEVVLSHLNHAANNR